MTKHSRRFSLLLVFLTGFSVNKLTATEPRFALKNADTWVMVGDSITAQRLHSNYIEAFYRTRYPHLNLHFRNSGVNGNSIPNVLDRFDYDVAAWKPTYVSVELGMNDSNAALARYTDGLTKVAKRLHEINAQPIFISSSPINDGSMMNAWVSLHCEKINSFTEALKELGEKLGIPTVDQYHPLIDLWGRNKILYDANELASRAVLYTAKNAVPGLKELQDFAASWRGKPVGVPLGGDPIHPGVVGQYCMAAVILKRLNADPEVSSASINVANAKPVVTTSQCKIRNVSFKNGTLSFFRLDERSPWPIAKAGLDAVKLMPEIANLSRYMLTIFGLPEGNYTVSMDGVRVTALSANQLSAGWNMSTIDQGPIMARAQRIIDLINRLQTKTNEDWRAASRDGDATKMEITQKAIDDCEAELQSSCQPKEVYFEITPTGT